MCGEKFYNVFEWGRVFDSSSRVSPSLYRISNIKEHSICWFEKECYVFQINICFLYVVSELWTLEASKNNGIILIYAYCIDLLIYALYFSILGKLKRFFNISNTVLFIF